MESNHSVRTTIYLPKETHKQFKIYCINRGETVTSALLDYIKGQLDNDINSKLQNSAVEYANKLMGSDGFK